MLTGGQRPASLTPLLNRLICGRCNICCRPSSTPLCPCAVYSPSRCSRGAATVRWGRWGPTHPADPTAAGPFQTPPLAHLPYRTCCRSGGPERCPTSTSWSASTCKPKKEQDAYLWHLNTNETWKLHDKRHELMCWVQKSFNEQTWKKNWWVSNWFKQSWEQLM